STDGTGATTGTTVSATAVRARRTAATAPSAARSARTNCGWRLDNVHQSRLVRDVDGDAAGHARDILAIPQIANRRGAGHTKLGERNRNGRVRSRSIEQCHRLPPVGQILGPNFAVSLLRNPLASRPQRVLIDRQHLVVR